MPSLSLGDWLKVGLVIFLILLAWYIHALNSKIEKLELELDLWKQTYTVLSEKVAEQNAAINKLEEQRKTALKKRAQANKKAAPKVAQAKSTETRLNAITPAPEESSPCEAELGAIKQMLEAAK